MFYSTNVLGKRNVLHLAWLAANNRKITHCNLQKANIIAIADHLKKEQNALSLRLTAQLTYGVTRLHEGQCKQLYGSAEKCLSRVRVKFRSGMVELTKEDAKPSMDAVTLPEGMISMMDMELGDLNEITSMMEGEDDLFAVDVRQPFLHTSGRAMFIANPMDITLPSEREESQFDMRKDFQMAFGQSLAEDAFALLPDTIPQDLPQGDFHIPVQSMMEEMVMPGQALSLEQLIAPEQFMEQFMDMPPQPEDPLPPPQEEREEVMGFSMPPPVGPLPSHPHHRAKRSLMVDIDTELTGDKMRAVLLDTSPTVMDRPVRLRVSVVVFREELELDGLNPDIQDRFREVHALVEDVMPEMHMPVSLFPDDMPPPPPPDEIEQLRGGSDLDVSGQDRLAFQHLKRSLASPMSSDQGSSRKSRRSLNGDALDQLGRVSLDSGGKLSNVVEEDALLLGEAFAVQGIEPLEGHESLDRVMDLIGEQGMPVIGFLRQNIEPEGQVDVAEALLGFRRRTVARTFAKLLVMCQTEFVVPEQDMPYGPIVVSPGDNYDALLLRYDSAIRAQ